MALVAQAISALSYEGVNLAGAEFGSSVPGTYGVDYIYPNQSEVDYYLGKGMNTFRLPFLWERLQPSLSSGFDPTEWSRLSTFVNETTAKGGHVILDPHNYAEYFNHVIGSPEVSVAQFASFWTQLATPFAGNDRVIFGLMNEPPGGGTISTQAWFTAAQSAVTAIRAGGANNLILVPGNGYTGAWSWVNDAWYGASNASVMGALSDPADNFAFEVHQYLDQNYSGAGPGIAHDPVDALSDFTNWLRQTGNRGFLGEFGVATGSVQQTAITAMLGYLDNNADVWNGWTWWAGGPWWGSYQFTLEPNGGVDAPQMAYLEPFLPDVVPEPSSGALVAVGAAVLAILARRRCRCDRPRD